jgi:hypothetical protein
MNERESMPICFDEPQSYLAVGVSKSSFSSRKSHLISNKLIFFGVFCLTLCPCVNGYGQSAAGQTSVPRDAKGLQLLESSMDMMCSLTRQQNLHAAIIHGTISIPSDPDTVTGTFTARLIGKHHYIETKSGSHQTKLTLRGKTGKFDRDGTSRSISPSGIMDVTSDLLPPLDNWAGFRDPRAGIRLLDDQTVNGVPCSQIWVALPANFAIAGHRTYDIRVFVRKDNGALRAVDYGMTQTSFYNPNVRSRLVYDNFKAFGSLTLPSTITRYINGMPISVLHLDDLEINQNLTEEDLDF